MVSLQRKSNQISEILSQLSSSPYSQVPRIKELISFLREEGADIDERIRCIITWFDVKLTLD